MEETGISVVQLVAATRLDVKLVKAMVEGYYTPSPSQREKLKSLGASTEARKAEPNLNGWLHAPSTGPLAMGQPLARYSS
jgi:hypothetical protein